MPRPLGVNLGDGTYRGMGFVSTDGLTPVVTSNITYLDTVSGSSGSGSGDSSVNLCNLYPAMCGGSGGQTVLDPWSTAMSPNVPSSAGFSIGQWISQNKSMLIIGGIVGLVLFARR